MKFELSAEEAGIESIFEVSLRVKEEFHYLTGREIKVTNNGTGFLLASQHKGYSFIDYKERRRNQLFHLLILSQEFEAEKGDNIVDILRNREGIVMAINAPGGGQIAFYNWQWARQESFLYPGFEFIKMEYLGDYLYIIAKERGVIGLYVRYGGTLKMALWAKTSDFEKKPLYEKERFSLNGMMVAWKSALYLGTKENSILKINKEGISSCILQVKGAIHSINERWHPEALAVVYQEGEDKKVIYNKENIQESVASYPLNT